MLLLLRSELYRMRRRWMPWVLMAIVAAMPIAIYLLIYFGTNAQLAVMRAGTNPGQQAAAQAMEQTLRSLRPDRVQGVGIGIVNGLGSIVLIAFAASHLGTEFSWGTLRTLLAHGAGRTGFLASKVVSIVLFAALLAGIGLISSVLASYLTSTIAGFETTPGVDWSVAGSAAARGLFTFMPYMALAILIAVLSRSAGAGITAGLVVYFAESIVTGIAISLNRDFANVLNYGISRNVTSITRVTVEAGSSATTANPTLATLPDQGQAAAVLATYTIAFVLIAWWRLRSRDVTLA